MLVIKNAEINLLYKIEPITLRTLHYHPKFIYSSPFDFIKNNLYFTCPCTNQVFKILKKSIYTVIIECISCKYYYILDDYCKGVQQKTIEI